MASDDDRDDDRDYDTTNRYIDAHHLRCTAQSTANRTTETIRS